MEGRKAVKGPQLPHQMFTKLRLRKNTYVLPQPFFLQPYRSCSQELAEIYISPMNENRRQ